MKQKSFSVILLAAGQGKRMQSPLPKVLHPTAGLPMILRIFQEVKTAGAKEVRVVVGHGENLVRQVLEPQGATLFRQKEQKGTADAVRSAQPETLEGPVLILNGDHPLITTDDVKQICEEYKNGSSGVTVVSAKVKKPGSYGRIVRQRGELKAIVEAKDASADTLKINEINTGIYMTTAEILKQLLPKISNNNAQKEFYFTDIISLAIEHKIPVKAHVMPKRVAQGVNSQEELATASRILFARNAKRMMEKGVVIFDPKTVYIEDDVQVGPAAVLYPNVYLKSGTSIGSFSVIESNCFLHKALIGESVQIRSGSYLEECIVKNKAVIGPYARLRPETEIGEDARVGNFVEMKKVKFAAGAKANHLTYLGDAEIGEGTNIGCGTITCNYAVDKKKYKTKIGKNVFVGSDTQFIAPIEIGDNAVIGSGSTITKNVPANALAVARGRQITKENYVSSAPSAAQTKEEK